jgi:hypothetical protein
MGYSTKADIEFYGQFSSDDFEDKGYDYEAAIAKAIQDADHMIEQYCNVPEGFFEPGGLEIQQELLNGLDIAYVGGITNFFNWYYGATSHLKLKHSPVLSVTKLEEETSADTWTQRTEGSGNDFIVVSDGVRFMKNTPAWRYNNVRVTYKAGYSTTPSQIARVSGMLAAAVLRQILKAAKDEGASMGGATMSNTKTSLSDTVFSEDLKQEIVNFKRVNYGFS